MRFLVDTDYVVDFLVNRSEATTLLSSLAQDGIAISLLTVGEILEGIYYGRDPKKSEALFRAFLATVDILSPNEATMEKLARIRGDLRRRGLLIGDFDTVIAATAIQHHLTLVTRNLKDYDRIPGLTLYPSTKKKAA